MKIYFLHTSQAHVKRFDEIVEKIDPNLDVKHFVNEQLLQTAQQTGKVDKTSFYQQVDQIRENGKGIIICTCSTYGDLCNSEYQVYRIDQPIVEFIISKFYNIGIAYTFHATKKISKRLIEKLSQKNKKSIQIFEIDCSHCWKWFEQGDLEKYEKEIATQVKAQSKHLDVVFLAQASMEGAKQYLTNEKYQVVSSPEFGVRKYLGRIKNKRF